MLLPVPILLVHRRYRAPCGCWRSRVALSATHPYVLSQGDLDPANVPFPQHFQDQEHTYFHSAVSLMMVAWSNFSLCITIYSSYISPRRVTWSNAVSICCATTCSASIRLIDCCFLIASLT